MKRTIRAAAIAVLLTGVAMAAPRAFADTQQQEPNQWRDRECRYARSDGHRGWSDREVLAAIACATSKWSVPGGYSGAVCIAEKESGLNEHARNSTSSAGGVYQWLESSWPFDSYPELTHRWGLRDSRFNARAAVVISVRVAQNGGWSPTWNVADDCGLS